MLIILFVGIALRVYFLFNYQLIDVKEQDVFLSDEAIVGLMARHIAAGTNFPVFFYGQHYLGAFEAYLVALLFPVLGVSMFALKVVPAIFSVALLFVVYALATKLFNARVGVLSTALVAVPSTYFFVWGFKARGGFIEHVVFSLLIFFVFSLIYFYRKSFPGLYALLGFLCGFALWINQLVLPYLAALAALLFLKRSHLLTKAKLSILLLSFLMGASPLIISNVREPLATARSVLSKGIKTDDTSRLDDRENMKRIIVGLLDRLKELPKAGRNLSIVFGKNKPQIDDADLLETTRTHHTAGLHRFYWIFPFLFFGSALLASFYQKNKFRLTFHTQTKPLVHTEAADKVNLLMLFFSVSLVGYFQPRYLLVCYPIAAILGAAFLDDLRGRNLKKLYSSLLLATVLLNLYGIVDITLNRRDESIEKLMDRLEAKGCRYGYSAGPMYHIAFHSLEKIIFVPLDENRYPQYEVEVGKASTICYVFRKDQEQKKVHLAFLQTLQAENIRYQQTKVDKYTIYYSFDPREKVRQG